MKLTSDNNELAESKVVILYLLDKIGKPITNSNLFKIVLSIQDMNYFYFQQFLLDLIDNKYITNYTKDENILYKITSTGREVLSLTNDIIPGILKLKIDNTFRQQLDNIQKEVSIISEYIPKSETDYIVKCKIIENNSIIFEIQTFAGSREQAKKIADNWKDNANSIYPKILDILIN